MTRGINLLKLCLKGETVLCDGDPRFQRPVIATQLQVWVWCCPSPHCISREEAFRSCIASKIWLGNEFYYSSAMPMAIVNCESTWSLGCLLIHLFSLQTKLNEFPHPECNVQQESDVQQEFLEAQRHGRSTWPLLHGLQPMLSGFLHCAAWWKEF